MRRDGRRWRAGEHSAAVPARMQVAADRPMTTFGVVVEEEAASGGAQRYGRGGHTSADPEHPAEHGGRDHQRAGLVANAEHGIGGLELWLVDKLGKDDPHADVGGGKQRPGRQRQAVDEGSAPASVPPSDRPAGGEASPTSRHIGAD